jgi:Flp pilus assembly protein TadD
MPRIAARLGVLALSVLLGSTALAGAAETQQNTLLQGLDVGIRDAQVKRNNHDYAGAVHILSQLMLVAPDDSRVVGEYGKVLAQQGRAREAIDFLGRAVQLQQGDWTLYSALGVALDQVGDYDSARGAYERALMLKPDEAAVLNNFAMSRMLAGDLAQAKRLIAQASAGSRDERVARNQKLIAGLTPPQLAAAPAPKAVPLAARTVATAGLPAAQKPPRPLTQPMVATAATQPPHALTKPGEIVMMQAVPIDLKAGPVAKSKPLRKIAKATPLAKPAASKGIPALRLANDRP